MNVSKAVLEKEYEIKDINTKDEEMKAFLFTLGCFEGQKLTVLSRMSGNYTVVIKGSRYNIDKELASVIEI